MPTSLVVDINKFKTQTIDCHIKGTNTFVTIKHVIKFFPVSKGDIIELNESSGVLFNTSTYVLRYMPRVRVEYTFDRFWGMMDTNFRTLNYIHKSDRERKMEINALQGIMFTMLHLANKDHTDQAIFDNIVAHNERKNKEYLRDTINQLILDYKNSFDKHRVDLALEAVDELVDMFSSTLTKSWSNRRLQLLKLTNNDINSLPMSPTELYNSLVEEKIYPFAFHHFTPLYGDETAFPKCCAIANILGIDYNDKISLILYNLNKNIYNRCKNNRNSYLPLSQYKSFVKEYMDKLNELFGRSITESDILDELILNYGVRVVDDRLYTYDLMMAEDHCFSALVDRIDRSRMSPDKSKVIASDSYREGRERHNDIKDLTDEQQEAFHNALKQPISAMTGGAGVGKTRTIATILKALVDNKKTVQLTSFTGKAVARMKDMCSLDSPYILDPVTMDLMICRSTSAPFDYVIIDEASMVTNILMSKFFYSFRGDYQILLVGDVNQLQPIGIGDFFFSMFKTCAVPITKLNKNFRVNSGGSLLPNIHSLTTGKHSLTESEDFVMYPTDGNDESMDVIEKLLKRLKALNMPPNQVKILSFFTEPINGLNRAMIKIFFDRDVGPKEFVSGQEVFMTVNVQSKDLYNGTVGVVGEETAGHYKVSFSGVTHEFLKTRPKDSKRGWNVVTEDSDSGKSYKSDDTLYVDMLEHGYCSSIHKSQGSEYNSVIVYCQHREKIPKSFLSLNLVYTAYSRARDCVYTVGNVGLISKALSNVIHLPLDHLTDRIREHFGITEEYKHIEIEDDCSDDDDDIGSWD